MNTFVSIGAKFGLDISDLQKGLARAQTMVQEFGVKSQQLLRQGGLRGPARLLGFAAPIYAMVEAYRLAIDRAKELKEEQDKQFDSELEHVKKIAETSKDAEQITKEWAHLEDFSASIDKDTAAVINFADSIENLKDTVGNLAIKVFGPIIQFGEKLGAGWRFVLDQLEGVGYSDANRALQDAFRNIETGGVSKLANAQQGKIYQAGSDVAAAKAKSDAAREEEENKKKLDQLRELGELTSKYIELLSKEKSLHEQLADILKKGREAEAIPSNSYESMIQKQKTVNDLLSQYNEVTKQINENKKQAGDLQQRLNKLNEEHQQRNRAEYEPTESEFASGSIGSGRDRAILNQAEIIKRRAQQAYAGGYTTSGDYYANQAELLRNQVHSRETSERALSETVFKQEADDIKTELKSLNAKLDPVQVN